MPIYGATVTAHNLPRPTLYEIVRWEGQPAQVRDVCDGVASLTLLDGRHLMVPVERLFCPICKKGTAYNPTPECTLCGYPPDDAEDGQ